MVLDPFAPSKARLQAFWSLAAGLAAWEAVSRAGLVPDVVLPPPSLIALRAGRVLESGAFLAGVWGTLVHVIPGFLLGASAGLALALVCGLVPAVDAVVDPWINATYPVPTIVLLAPLLVLLGTGPLLCVAIVAITALYNVFLPTRSGVCRVEKSLLDAAADLGATRWQALRHVVLPSILPDLFVGLHLGILRAFTVAIVVEMLLSLGGLGETMWLASSWLRMEAYYVYVVAVAALATLLVWSLRRARRALVPWAEESRGL